jgi:hypothetical protein
MANHNAGNALQRAIDAGVAKQCSATCKATGERCRRAARIGYDVCSVHGAGTKVRETNLEKRSPGRPIVHGLYSRALRQEHLDTFLENLGDLSLVRESALVKTLLNNFIESMFAEVQCAGDGAEIQIDDDVEIIQTDQSDRKKKQLEQMTMLIKLIETVVKTTTAAHEQIKGKKIVVSLDTDSQSIADEARKLVRDELQFVVSLLCPECRERVSQALMDRQMTVLE